jgi:hypothetical protein
METTLDQLHNLLAHVRRFWRAAFRDIMGLVGIVALFGAAIAFGQSCGPTQAFAAPSPSAAPAGPVLDIKGSELEAGVRIYRVSFGGEVCYAVVGEMGGMASGRQAAVDCI